jgi:hypothetical protein
MGDGPIDRKALEAYVIPIYERTAEEVRRPFLGELGERLELRDERIEAVENPVATAFRRDGDAAKFGRDFTGFFRAFSEPSLRVGLRASDAGIEELYRRLERRLEETAETFVFEVNALSAVIART